MYEVASSEHGHDDCVLYEDFSDDIDFRDIECTAARWDKSNIRLKSDIESPISPIQQFDLHDAYRAAVSGIEDVSA